MLNIGQHICFHEYYTVPVPCTFFGLFVFYLFWCSDQKASQQSALSTNYWMLKREMERGEEKELCRFVSKVAS